MAEQTFETHRTARDQKRHVAAATAIGVNAVKPFLQFQISLLRLWADNIESFTRNYEKQLSAEVEQQGQQDRAA